MSAFDISTVTVERAAGPARNGIASGVILAAAFSPKHFEIPSLLADMGAVTPRFNGVVIAIVILAALVAVLAGAVRTIWILVRGPVARMLRRDAL